MLVQVVQGDEVDVLLVILRREVRTVAPNLIRVLVLVQHVGRLGQSAFHWIGAYQVLVYEFLHHHHRAVHEILVVRLEVEDVSRQREPT